MLKPVEGLQEIVSLEQSVRRIVQALPQWEEDALVELYRQSTVLEERSLVVRAAVVAEFVRRMKGDAKRVKGETWQRIAQTLGERRRNVWYLYRIWEEILSRVEAGEDFGLPQRMYEAALSARKHGIDPLEAVRYASHIRNVLDPNYSREEFLQDIRRGLPSPEDRPQREKPPCFSCPWYKTASEGEFLALVRAGKEKHVFTIVAMDTGTEDIKYCEKNAVMGKDLFRFRAECPERGGARGAQKDCDCGGEVCSSHPPVGDSDPHGT